jgi:hypothetical protein
MTKAPTPPGYETALLAYVRDNAEANLVNAYQFGRTTLDAGCGLLQILHVHEKAMGIILDATPVNEELRRRFDASARFLFEALSPYEMACAGYRALLENMKR